MTIEGGEVRPGSGGSSVTGRDLIGASARLAESGPNAPIKNPLTIPFVGKPVLPGSPGEKPPDAVYVRTTSVPDAERARASVSGDWCESLWR